MHPSSRPVYSTENIETQSHRRLLLVSWHFTPDSAIGARRWEKIVHYAAECGWGVDVLMREQHIDIAGRARLSLLPPGVRIFQIPFHPLKVQRLEQSLNDAIKGIRARLSSSSDSNSAFSSDRGGEKYEGQPSLPVRFARAYWAAVDSWKFLPWAATAVKTAKEIFSPQNHFAVVSSGPPYMMHEAGRRISSFTRLPFIMDMRDPWSLNEQVVEDMRSPVWYYLARRYEKAAIDQATLIIANTEVARKALGEKYPARREDIITVMNGIDDDPFPVPTHKDRKKFVIAHAGTLYLDRDPTPLFRAVSEVIRNLKLSPSQIGISLIGSLSDGNYSLRSVINDLGISDYVEIGPPRSHTEALAFMAEATVLVVMAGSNRSAIPAKVFEYMRFKAWLLAMCPTNSATAQLLAGTDSDVVESNDISAITSVITKRYLEFRAGETPPLLKETNPEWSREEQARYLIAQIKKKVPVSAV